jgi:hypothetical protein
VTDSEQRELSNQAAKRMSLVDVRLSSIRADLKNYTPSYALQVSGLITNSDLILIKEVAAYEVGYKFLARDRDNKNAWEVSFTLILSFRLKQGDNMADNLLQAFGGVAVMEIAHPYVRELLHSMTARMNMPAFMLEVMGPDWLGQAEG